MRWWRWLIYQATKHRVLRREVCKRCFRENPVGFMVPNDVWASVVPERYRNKVLCIFCFDELATKRGIDWSSHFVEFWPVSGVAIRRLRALQNREG